jgi:HAD superfamily phosphatase (TIGR01668 family)
MPEVFYPDETAESAYDIDYGRLWKEGYRGIIYDIDNTLVLPDAPADARSDELLNRLGKMGFIICLSSNNGRERVEAFNRNVNVHYVAKVLKPSLKGYRRALELMGTRRRETVCIGDQIFTDVWGARRAGMHVILTKPFTDKEEFQIILKRILEKVVLHFYYKKYGRGTKK